MIIKNFWELEAWKLGHELVLEVYSVMKDFPDDERFGITSQLRRSVSSITANIAEGFERYHIKDKIKFYYQARGSAAEVQNFIILSQDLLYIDLAKGRLMFLKTIATSKLINGLIRSLSSFQTEASGKFPVAV